jgi:hypothetical protein
VDLLLEKIVPDHKVDVDLFVEEIADKIVRIVASGATFISAPERLERLVGTWGIEHAEVTRPSGETVSFEVVRFEEEKDSAATFLGDWLAYYGPNVRTEISLRLGLSMEAIRILIEDLVATERVITGDLVDGGSVQTACDASNLESLLRIARVDAIPDFEALPTTALQLFLALYQGLVFPGSRDLLGDRVSTRSCCRLCFVTVGRFDSGGKYRIDGLGEPSCFALYRT